MDHLKYSEILKQNLLLVKEVKDLTPYRINILSNITCSQLDNVLTYNLRKSVLNPVIKIGNYDNIIQESYDCKEIQLVVIHYDLLNILDKYNDFIEDFADEQISLLFNSIKSEIDLILDNLRFVPAVVFNTFTSSAIYTNAVIPSKTELLAKKLNEYLYSKKETNLQILDINMIISKIGVSNSFDFRMFFLSKTLYTILFWKEYVYMLSSIVFKYTGMLKKAIIFDCDNTLWKGILGEDGMAGIDMSAQSKTGQVYNKIQRLAVWLSNHGVIIGLCSKNNLDDVERVMSEHADMRLTKDHIVISKVNWLDKATNLRDIAKELNIGLNSIVFVDDSSFEINLIKDQIPEILTFQVPTAIFQYPEKFLKIVERNFYLTDNSADIEKTKQYKDQTIRNEEKNKYQSLDDYLSSIDIEILINENDRSQIPRIAQITQKTNQFNLTTKRYTENQIEIFMNNENDRVFSVFVKDKFGESGLTAVLIVNENNYIVNIDSFIMSCRIMGRNIEKAIMNYLVETYKQKGFSEITAAYFPTVKNIPVTSFYEDSGFHLIKEDVNNKFYSMRVSDYKTHKVDYIKIKKQYG